MRIAIGCDHRGFRLKQAIMGYLAAKGHTVKDFGCYDDSSADYPDFAKEVSYAVAKGDFDRGILICNTGIGMSIAANKVPGIRAALCHDVFTARSARQHNDANVLCLGAAVVSQSEAEEIVQSFVTTGFDGGRHQRRLDKVRVMEEKAREGSNAL